MCNNLNKKRIGCVIAYKKDHTNYGTALVGFSLIAVLQDLGYQVDIINYIKDFTLRQKFLWVVNAFRCGMGQQVINRFVNRYHLKKRPEYAEWIKIRTRCVEDYKNQQLVPFFKNFVGYSALCEGSKQYDAVIVGSDQVWLPQGLKTGFFNLLFVADEIRKVSYASSFGVSHIPKFQHKETGHYLNRFYRISVRELAGKKIVEDLSDKEAQVVADPTLLLNRERWEREARGSSFQVGSPYIFCYFLGSNPEARLAANDLKARTGYRIVTLRHMDEYIEKDEMFGDEFPYNVNPIDFVKLIRDAQYVCTDSFHCTAFSIQFHKQFMTFYRFSQSSKAGRNSRIDSLMDVLDRKSVV